MKYSVIVTPEAENDLREAYRYIRPHSTSKTALVWLTGARKKIKTLSDYPERAQSALESVSLQQPIRELLYSSGNRGVYRILFTILNGTVFVLHLRHGSMLSMEPNQ